MDIIQILQDELKIKRTQVQNTIQLIDEGNTIPFIARYRKELTGGLNDEILRRFGERYTYLLNLEARKAQVTKSIEEQGKLTEELALAIEKAMTATEVEDLYLPYRPKKRTRATIAKEKGLEPLAKMMMEQKEANLEQVAADFVSEEKGVTDIKSAIMGAQDILAEEISDDADFRGYIRKLTYQKGLIVTKAKDEKAETVFDMYYDYSEKISAIPGHRILAINRGENEKALSVKIEAPFDEILAYLERKIIRKESTTI